MRVLLGVLLAMMGTVFAMQSSQQFRTRYGEPNIEGFVVRPRINVSLEVGSDHLVCQALIQPPKPLLQDEQVGKPMSSVGRVGNHRRDCFFCFARKANQQLQLREWMQCG